MDGLLTRNAATGLDAVQAAIDQGADARQIARQMVDYMRLVLQARLSQKDGLPQVGDVSESDRLELAAFAQKASAGLLLRGIRAFSSAISEMRGMVDSQLFLELAYLECAIADEPAQVRPAQAEERLSRQPTGTPPAGTPPASTPRAERAEPAPPARPATVAQTASTPAPAGTPPAADHDDNAFETLRAQWRPMIQQVNGINKPTAALLRSCHPYGLEGNVVRIKADHDLIRQRLDDPKHHEVMTAAINQLLNGRFSVRVFTGAPDQEPDLEEDPVVKAAKKLGGQVREE
jgi:DNA polymerase-3 subunit gamma/tau